jgi:hypothetical protein
MKLVLAYETGSATDYHFQVAKLHITGDIKITVHHTVGFWVYQ